MSVTANHVAFLLSFASVFLLCYVGSQFLGSVLNDSGYDPFATILAHEKQPENMSAQLTQYLSNNQLAQLVAIALTAATSVFIFLQFSQSELKPVYACVRLMHISRVEEACAGSPELARVPAHKKDYRLAEHRYVGRYPVTPSPLVSHMVAIDLACQTQMISSAFQLVSTSQSLQLSTAKKSCEATHPRVVTITLATSTC